MVSGIYEGVLQCITFWAGVLYSTISEVKIPIMQIQTDCICGQQNTPQNTLSVYFPRLHLSIASR